VLWAPRTDWGARVLHLLLDSGTCLAPPAARARFRVRHDHARYACRRNCGGATAALIEEFEKRVSPSLERIRAALLDTRTLASLRDTLLPKLISGELRVKDAERVAATYT